LRTPGLSAEGGGTDFLKWALRLHTLGSFANSLGIGTYTTETSWSSDDFESRVQPHVVTVEALLLAGARDGKLAARHGAAADAAQRVPNDLMATTRQSGGRLKCPRGPILASGE
jgi:hypothetical protein